MGEKNTFLQVGFVRFVAFLLGFRGFWGLLGVCKFSVCLLPGGRTPCPLFWSFLLFFLYIFLYYILIIIRKRERITQRPQKRTVDFWREVC